MAYLFQDSRAKAKLGDKAPWSVGWYDHAGRKRTKKVGAKSTAEKYRKKVEARAALAMVEGPPRTKWADFRTRFADTALATKPASTVNLYRTALDNFQRIAKPVYLDTITTETVDRFRVKRSKEPQRGRYATKDRPAAPPVSPATVNRELRHLRAALRKAYRWGLIERAPEVEFLREVERDPYFIDDAAFAKLFDACDTMTRPAGYNFTPADWWRALLAFSFLTGWRIGEILDLRRDDLDFDAGTARVDAESTRGRREAVVALHPVVMERLRTIADFTPTVFPWPHPRRTIHRDFAKLKAAAGVDFPGAFHRFRYGFASANVDRFDANMLQKLMRHQAPQTTRHYINAAERMKRAGVADRLHVPAALRGSAT